MAAATTTLRPLERLLSHRSEEAHLHFLFLVFFGIPNKKKSEGEMTLKEFNWNKSGLQEDFKKCVLALQLHVVGKRARYVSVIFVGRSTS